uniref:Uncharacterized protein n=1 Tax=Sphaerodactylus townsendi TaxID=933632 RepID=A0ACB8FLU4_9SAUR
MQALVMSEPEWRKADAPHRAPFCRGIRGTIKAIRRLLHVAVSDVNDDVRRAAVESLGFILFRWVASSGGPFSRLVPSGHLSGPIPANTLVGADSQ